MTGIRASQKEKVIRRLLYRTRGSGSKLEGGPFGAIKKFSNSLSAEKSLQVENTKIAKVGILNPNEPSGALKQPTFFPISDSFCQ